MTARLNGFPAKSPGFIGGPLLHAAFVLAGVSSALADDPSESRRAIARGLKYLADAQSADGRWEGDGGAYRVAVTSLAGLAFLMDGDTPAQGAYAERVDRAVRYVLLQAQPSGLIGNPDQDNRYLYGHGFAMLFLSQVFGEEADARQREAIRRALAKAVIFCGQSQTNDGGWGYVSALDGKGFDEGSVTVTQMQGLRGCRNAGVPVPKEIIDKGVQYIERCTDAAGGVRYSLKTNGGSRPPLSAAALACLFSAGEQDHRLAARLHKAADRAFAHVDAATGAIGHWHYAHYYYSQVVYRQDEALWQSYRKRISARLIEEQEANGSWNQAFVGPAYTTALNLSILQLDGAALPIYQR